MVSNFAGLVPYVAGLYMMFFLGVFGLYTLTQEFSVLTMLRSIFFTIFGYKSLDRLWMAT